MVLEDRNKNRCLLCHDGTVTDESSKYLSGVVHHPLFVEMKGKTDLPLAEGNKVYCASCHNPHHRGDRPFLRKERTALCLSCHQDHGASETNHRNKSGDTMTCLECHVPHGGNGKILKLPVPDLCLSCHKNKSASHKILKSLPKDATAKGLRFANDQISCITCHTAHNSQAGSENLRDPAVVVPFCANCHDDDAAENRAKFHSLITGGAK